jgi:hypothetical protein
MSRICVLRAASVLTVMTAFACVESSVRADEFQVGKAVIPKSADFSLKDGDSTSRPKSLIRPFVIRKIEGDRLYLAAGEFKGWTTKSAVLVRAEAEAYFSNVIRSNPGDSFGYLMRKRWQNTTSPSASILNKPSIVSSVVACRWSTVVKLGW